MLSKYSHTNSESLAQNRATFVEIQNLFLGGCFFLLAHPVQFSLVNSGLLDESSPNFYTM